MKKQKSIFESVPNRLNLEKNFYTLHSEETINGDIILTYENEPIKEDSFLVSTIGKDFNSASMSMMKYLEIIMNKK